VSDGGAWLRRQSLILAKNYSTSVSYWLSVPLRDLREWIITSNDLVRDQKEETNE